MEQQQRNSLVGGIFFVILGLFFLLGQVVPGLMTWFDWPFIIIGVGLLFFIAAILGGVGGLAVPACVISGVGMMLFYQNATGNWESWSYLWPLIPGFVGVGLIIGGVISPEMAENRRAAKILLTISGLGLVIFGMAFTLDMNRRMLGSVALILIGMVMLFSRLFHRAS